MQFQEESAQDIKKEQVETPDSLGKEYEKDRRYFEN